MKRFYKDIKIGKNPIPEYFFVKNEKGVTVLKYTASEFVGFMQRNFGPFSSFKEIIDYYNKYFEENGFRVEPVLNMDEKISNAKFRVAELRWELEQAEKNLENLKRGIE